MAGFLLAAVLLTLFVATPLLALYNSRKALRRIKELEDQSELLQIQIEKMREHQKPPSAKVVPPPARVDRAMPVTPAKPVVVSAPAAIPVPSVCEPPERPSPPARSVRPSRAIDWENFTGVRLFAWLGGLALFFGVAFFVKYTIDRELISPVVRVAIGFLAGLASIVGGLALRRHGYVHTVQTLCAAGIAILYADVFAAHTYYHFIGVTPTFLLMTLVTTASFLLSVRLDAPYVAILSMVGGFLTPPILSTGVDRPLGLFGYIALLNIGLAAVGVHRRWGFLVGLAALGTLGIEIGWVQKFFLPEKAVIAVCVYGGFSLFFMAVLKIAERLRYENKWIFASAAGMPLLAMGFTAYLLQFSELAAQPWLALTYLALLDLAVGLYAWLRPDFRQVHAGAGVIGFLVLLYWTVEHLTPGLLLWGLSFDLCFAALHSILPILLERRFPAAKPLLLGHLYPLLMLVLTLVPIVKEVTVPQVVWLFVLLIDLIAFAAVILTGAAWSAVAAIVLTFAFFGVWIGKVPIQPPPGEFLSFLALLALFSLLFFACALLIQRKLKSRDAQIQSDLSAYLPALAVLLPFLLLSSASTRLALMDPSPVFGLGLILSILIIGLVRYQRADAAGAVGLMSVVILLFSWHLRHFESARPGIALTWYVVFFVVWTAFPFLFRQTFCERKIPWGTAAFAGPVFFYLFHKAVRVAMGTEYIGLLPAAFAVVYLGGLFRLVRSVPKENPIRLTQLSLFGGVALFFISLIFPLQFEKEWITIGWAIEGMALAWLYRKIPHEALKIWSAALLVIAFARLALNPAVLTYHVRAPQVIFNWYLYAYGAVIVSFLFAARLLRPPHDRIFGRSAPPIFTALAGILGFLLLNVEIADFFSAGTTLTFQFRGSLARDMTYSLGWAIYGFGILLLGIRFESRAARLAALGLIVVTALKVFLHDLWHLGQLYRVASLVGLAGVLIVVSFLYQRLLTTAKK